MTRMELAEKIFDLGEYARRRRVDRGQDPEEDPCVQLARRVQEDIDAEVGDLEFFDGADRDEEAMADGE